MSWDKVVAAFKAPSTKEFQGAQQAQDHSDGSRTVGYAAADEKGHLEPHVFTRRQPGPNDIYIQVSAQLPLAYEFEDMSPSGPSCRTGNAHMHA